MGNDILYYEGINQGDHYLCDRCEVAKLRADEFELNVRDIVDSENKMRYIHNKLHSKMLI
jgi:hypothetical protein